MKKLVPYFALGLLICLMAVWAFRYFHRTNMPAIDIPAEGRTAPAASSTPAPQTNPAIEPIKDTAQSVNVNSYTPEQARLRDFFQSESTTPARGEQAPGSGK